MQRAVGPFDRLFEAPRDEMSDSDINGVARGTSGESYELAGRDRYRFTARQQRGQRQRSARRAEGQRARGIPKA